MRLNHINLCASDVTALADKLVTHFGYRIIDSGRAPLAGGGGFFAAVTGNDGSELVITQIEPIPNGGSAYPKGFHFGLIQDSREAVYAKHAELTAAGLNPGKISDGFQVWGATWTAFYCPLGDGLDIDIEVNYRTTSALLDTHMWSDADTPLHRSSPETDHDRTQETFWTRAPRRCAIDCRDLRVEPDHALRAAVEGPIAGLIWPVSAW